MIYLKTYEKIFSNLFKKEESFETILNKLSKYIDSICPDEIFKLKINSVNIEDHPNKESKDGFILIKLKESDNKFQNHKWSDEIVIHLSYNNHKKFDMLTWSYKYINAKISIPEINDLYTKVQEYLIDNKLVGQVI